jgi:hypothetical protein
VVEYSIAIHDALATSRINLVNHADSFLLLGQIDFSTPSHVVAVAAPHLFQTKMNVRHRRTLSAYDFG